MSGRRPLVAGNWKMHHGGASACELAAAVRARTSRLDAVDLMVAPPFTALAAVAHELDGSRVAVGAQNVHARPHGAFTGEVAASMLAECGATWVIVGHSERRHLFAESDADVAAKTAAALAAGLSVIVCVGETLDERDAGRTFEVVERQLRAATGALRGHERAAAIAYEPVWAIGTGRTATPAQAEEVHARLRAVLAAELGENGAAMRIVYGGSVKPDNAAALFAEADVDGALVGGASLDAETFGAIADAGQARGAEMR